VGILIPREAYPRKTTGFEIRRPEKPENFVKLLRDLSRETGTPASEQTLCLQVRSRYSRLVETPDGTASDVGARERAGEDEREQFLGELAATKLVPVQDLPTAFSMGA
jgi:hypothetical protein